MAKLAKGRLCLVLFFGIFSFCQAGIEDMLRDPTFVKKEIDCMLDRGTCDRFGISLKAALTEVLGNDCRRCSPQQMINALKIMEFMEKHHQSEWYEILLKYQTPSER